MDADESCIFCRIAQGDAAASIAYRDERVVAFMDLRQFNIGHTLVVPMRHVPDIFALDRDTGAALMSATSRIATVVRAAVDADGISIWQSNGAAAGQEVFHLHIHVVPRFANDGLLKVYPSKPGYPTREELDRQAASIAERLVD